MFSFAALALLFADNLPNKTNALALVRLWRPPCTDCCCKVACRVGHKRLTGVRRQAMQHLAQQCLAQDAPCFAGAVQHKLSMSRCSVRPPKPAVALQSEGQAA